MFVRFWLKQHLMAMCMEPDHELLSPGLGSFKSYCAGMSTKHCGKGPRSSPYEKLSFGRRPPTPMQQKLMSFEGECVDSSASQAASSGSAGATCASVPESSGLPVRSSSLFMAHKRQPIKGKQSAPLWYWMQWEAKLGNMPPATWKHIRLAQGNCEAWYLHMLNLEHQELWPYKQKREACREMWHGLHRGERAMWISCAIDGKSAITVPEIHETISVYDLPHGITYEDIQEGKRVRGILTTFHGQWGYDLPDIQLALDRGIE